MAYPVVPPSESPIESTRSPTGSAPSVPSPIFSPGEVGSIASLRMIVGSTASNTAKISTNVPTASLARLLVRLRIAGPVANVASFASGSSEAM